MNSKDEMLEAALLARMVGTHLASVDHYTVEKTSNPANKINMQSFVAPLLGSQTNPNGNVYNEFANSANNASMVAMQEAANRLALEKYPDVSPNIEISNINNHSVVHSNTSREASMSNISREVSIINRSDIDSIRNSLNTISKTLTSFLKHLQEKK